MSEELEQCCNRLNEELNRAEGCLADLRHHLTTAVEEKVEGLEARYKNALAKCDAKREQATQAGERLRQFLENKKNEVVLKYEDWKTSREIEKLEKHADQKEEQAVDAVVVAAYALLEAEAAIVDALKARKIALEVAG